MTTIDSLNIALNEYQSSATRLRQYIYIGENECRKLIETISKKKFIQCEKEFHRLEQFQGIFSSIVYKEHFPVSQQIIDFVYFFDRLDDNNVKEYWYRKFCAGEIWPSESRRSDE
ncbi:hypothetical protein [Brenneria rubrifaciens]|uniref:Uncharacterized protein n=1 Tax=Brenneria rubrifaciens TaxID=55213 RepID=A0A4P8QSF6_9GAMM|nr:hypothetical protein [Brenneria rubrifaciens]QCR10102.1 hypothetical protein EH207_17325 [Brenneria rubrifaciens]